jgi:hypothetical protein
MNMNFFGIFFLSFYVHESTLKRKITQGSAKKKKKTKVLVHAI